MIRHTIYRKAICECSTNRLGGSGIGIPTTHLVGTFSFPCDLRFCDNQASYLPPNKNAFQSVFFLAATMGGVDFGGAGGAGAEEDLAHRSVAAASK